MLLEHENERHVHMETFLMVIFYLCVSFVHFEHRSLFWHHDDTDFSKLLKVLWSFLYSIWWNHVEVGSLMAKKISVTLFF